MLRITIAAALAVAASQAGAQRAPNPIDQATRGVQRGMGDLTVMAVDGIMAKGDVNRDGAIDHAEMRRVGGLLGRPDADLDPASWRIADINRDGVLSRRELIETFGRVMANTQAGRRPF